MDKQHTDKNQEKKCRSLWRLIMASLVLKTYLLHFDLKYLFSITFSAFMYEQNDNSILFQLQVTIAWDWPPLNQYKHWKLVDPKVRKF